MAVSLIVIGSGSSILLAPGDAKRCVADGEAHPSLGAPPAVWFICYLLNIGNTLPVCWTISIRTANVHPDVWYLLFYFSILEIFHEDIALYYRTCNESTTFTSNKHVCGRYSTRIFSFSRQNSVENLVKDNPR